MPEQRVSSCTTWLRGLMRKLTFASSCDLGTPLSFDYNIDSLGVLHETSGGFVMEGLVNNNQTVTDALLNAIEHVLLQSQQCTEKTGQKCAFSKKRDPDSGPELSDCQRESL